jgi:hypothetical protein
MTRPLGSTAPTQAKGRALKPFERLLLGMSEGASLNFCIIARVRRKSGSARRLRLNSGDLYCSALSASLTAALTTSRTCPRFLYISSSATNLRPSQSLKRSWRRHDIQHRSPRAQGRVFNPPH